MQRVDVSTILFTLFSRVLLIILLIFLAIPLALCLLVPKRFLVNNPLFLVVQEIFHWYCIKFSLVPIRYKGILNLPEQPCIIVANHQSSFDIPLIGHLMGKRPHIWLAWKELTKSPLLKFILPRIAVLVDATSPSRGLRTLIQAINTVKSHPWDLIIFPEGGRFTDGTVHEFFGGFVTIAKKTGRPVVPVKIIGAQNVYPPHTFWIYYHPITVIVGKPMVIEPNETEEAFKQRVYNWFIDDTKDS